MRRITTRRLRSRAAVVALWCLLAAFVANAHAITIPTVPVGNPGNAPDQDYGFGPLGAVSYAYRIGTSEVTNAQYVDFLNAKAASDPLGLYLPNMTSDPVGGITQSGISGSFAYSVKPDMGNKPVNYVGFYEALRFANWLHNGQGNGDTQTGAYTLLGDTEIPTNASSIVRNVGATWFLPNENEWYKAAYYQPAGQGGDSDNYWFYPTRTNSVPNVASADSVGNISNPGANVVNYASGADWNGQDGNVTTVGSAGLLSTSFYGTSDQGGNVMEWDEGIFTGIDRILRGGNYGQGDAFGASDHNSTYPNNRSPSFGFRVATIVPEPSSLVLAALGVVCGCAWGWRRRKRLN